MKLVYTISLVVLSVLFIGVGSASSQSDQNWMELRELAKSLHKAQKVDSAIAICRLAIQEAEKQVGPEDIVIARLLAQLAGYCFERADYAEVEALSKRVLLICDGVNGAEGLVVSTLRGIGDTRQAEGKYDEAERYYLQALDVSEKHPVHLEGARAFVLTHLGQLYRRMGRLSEAEPLLEQALEIRQRSDGPRHKNVAQNLHQLALVYRQQGRLTEAIRLEQQALSIREEVFGPEHFDVASSLNDLANFYRESGRYSEAAELQHRSLAVVEKALGSEHPWVGYVLNDLAGIYEKLGRYKEADPLYRRAQANLEASLGPEHPDVAISHCGLAMVAMRQSNYEEAERLIEQALRVRQKALGNNHYHVAYTLECHSLLRRLQDRGPEALELAGRAVAIRQHNFVENAWALTERDALAYSRFLRNSLHNYISCFAEQEIVDQAVVERVADAVLSAKGQVSDGIFRRRKRLISETDSTTIALAEELKHAMMEISELYVGGFSSTSDLSENRLDSLSELVHELETDLCRLSASFRAWRNAEEITAIGISSLLPEKSVLVEYLEYNHYMPRLDSIVQKYIALVLNEAGDVNLVSLGAATDIDCLINEYRRHMIRLSETAGLPKHEDEQRYVQLARDLYVKVWEPIERFVRGKEQIFLASDAGLNLIPFATLVDSEGGYLIERAVIHNLSAGRDMLTLQTSDETAKGLFAMGAPDYDATAEQRTTSSEAEGPAAAGSTLLGWSRGAFSASGSFDPGTVPPLPLSRYEVDQIVNIWKDVSSEPVTVYFDADATEDRFKAEAPGHRVIHLATHGYYIDSGLPLEGWHRTGEVFSAGHPLLLSGLFLAGSNVRRDSAEGRGLDDGILTAYEISSLNLRGTRTVVLSACETGLGGVQEGEGVYGLRRAFQMAGARTVVSSLWPVSDRVAAAFMKSLYAAGGESLSVRLRDTQLSMIADLRAKNLSDHPVSWGAFITSGDWR